MEIRKLAFNLKTDHFIIQKLLKDVVTLPPKEAKQLFPILRQLIVNHFLVEELLFYPLIKKKQLQSLNETINLYGERSGKDDLKALKKEIEHYESIGARVIAIMSECAGLKKTEFRECMKTLADLVKSRIDFEETILLKPIDTSEKRMTNKQQPLSGTF